ncbi:MAG: hypothetical protein SGI74_05315 [Oligoflexia bacterium]|nr:hypothetical protein [Oligoflexia bacterium]
MKSQKQLGFEFLADRNIKHFGGAYLKNSNPKSARPLSTKRCMHLVMRSSYAKGPYSLLKKNREIQNIINTQGKAFGVKVYRQANGGNHLHLIILPRSRQAFIGFVRAISGLIARAALDTQRGRPLFGKKRSSHMFGISKVSSGGRSEGNSTGFWDKRPFTRIIEWGREFKTVSNYLLQNTLEALGFIAYQPRQHRFKSAESTA